MFDACNQETAKKDFWKDANKSKKIIKEKNFLEGILNFYKNTVNELNNLKDLNKLASEEENLEILNDCEKKISNTFFKASNSSLYSKPTEATFF